MSPVDIAVSVYTQLTRLSRSSGRPFQDLLQFFGIERFLYRLSQTQYGDRLILKGALMLYAWDAPAFRPTRDIDFLGRLDNSLEKMKEVTDAACRVSVEPDGLVFDPSTIMAERIKEDADYQGVRVRLMGFLGKSRIPIQIDVGFGDAIATVPEVIAYPTLLGFSPPRLQGYPKEAIVAEKVEAMVKLGLFNSRMKDFYDINLLARIFDFEGAVLLNALKATFERRGTIIPVDTPVALTTEFATDKVKNTQWTAFTKRLRAGNQGDGLGETVQNLVAFLLPVIDAARREQPFERHWMAGGPWK